jgi:hypothetical protein
VQQPDFGLFAGGLAGFPSEIERQAELVFRKGLAYEHALLKSLRVEIPDPRRA